MEPKEDKGNLTFVCPYCHYKGDLNMVMLKQDIYKLEEVYRLPSGEVKYGIAKKATSVPRGNAYYCPQCTVRFDTIEQAFYNV